MFRIIKEEKNKTISNKLYLLDVPTEDLYSKLQRS